MRDYVKEFGDGKVNESDYTNTTEFTGQPIELNCGKYICTDTGVSVPSLGEVTTILPAPDPDFRAARQSRLRRGPARGVVQAVSGMADPVVVEEDHPRVGGEDTVPTLPWAWDRCRLRERESSRQVLYLTSRRGITTDSPNATPSRGSDGDDFRKIRARTPTLFGVRRRARVQGCVRLLPPERRPRRLVRKPPRKPGTRVPSRGLYSPPLRVRSRRTAPRAAVLRARLGQSRKRQDYAVKAGRVRLGVPQLVGGVCARLQLDYRRA